MAVQSSSSEKKPMRGGKDIGGEKGVNEATFCLGGGLLSNKKEIILLAGNSLVAREPFPVPGEMIEEKPFEKKILAIRQARSEAYTSGMLTGKKKEKEKSVAV